VDVPSRAAACSDGGWLDRAHPGSRAGAWGRTVRCTRRPPCQAVGGTRSTRSVRITWRGSSASPCPWALFSALGSAGLPARSATQAGLLKGLDLHVLSTPSAIGPRRRRVMFCRKHATGGSRMRLARFGCRWGRRASLSSPERTEPSLTPAVSRRAGTADLRAPRPKGQGRCAMANTATEGIPHDDVSRVGARNGGNC